MEISTQRFESPFGPQVHSQWAPPQLARAVEVIWHFAGSIGSTRERSFPTGTLELVVHLDERFRLVERNRREPFSGVCVSGLYSRPFVIEGPPGHCRVLGIRLRPAGAYALFARPLHEISDLTVDVADLVGTAAAELAERAAAAPDVAGCLRATAGWIAGRLAKAPCLDPAVARALARIDHQGGALSIAALREEIGSTKTRFTTAFREQVGVTPKVYARLRRFRRLVALLHPGTLALADAALEAGFYDQAPMNAEFRELAGSTPQRVLRRALPHGRGPERRRAELTADRRSRESARHSSSGSGSSPKSTTSSREAMQRRRRTVGLSSSWRSMAWSGTIAPEELTR
jgi:methylphosphotriester-DNA--protein-cysteine methyltransferase